MKKGSCCTVLLLLTFGVSVCNSVGKSVLFFSINFLLLTEFMLCTMAFLFSLAVFYPNVTLQGTGTPEITPINTIFIYNWMAEEQAKNPGFVTAFEYCFQRTTVTPMRPVFSFFLLEPVPTGYMIERSIDVITQNFSSCSDRGGVDTCCARESLKQLDWFQVPTRTSRAFGIYARGSNRILGTDPEKSLSTTGLQIPGDRKDDTFISTKASLTTVTYRLFNMVIGKQTITYIHKHFVCSLKYKSPHNLWCTSASQLLWANIQIVWLI